ncbi:MAG: hypothetical protein ACK6DC_01405 [Planctomycetota bacterium]|jgi:hypothetical protein
MIAAKRTSWDSVAILLPVQVFFTVLMTYISLAAYGLAPVVGNISPDAIWLAPLISIFLWFIMVRYIYRLIYPVIYLTEVFPDRIVFSDSSNPDGSMVLLRSDISWFYVKPRHWWHGRHGRGLSPVLGETRSGQAITIRLNFVCEGNSEGFFAAIRAVWGEEYVGDSEQKNRPSVE